MNSPFPGMDPYLDRYWRDVHQSLITYTRDALQDRLPASLRARIESRVYLESELEVGGNRFPDVYVAEHPRPKESATSFQPKGGIAIAEPVLISLSDEPVTESYLEIREVASGNRVVTVIEFLSPTNKLAGPGREQYQRKQRECIAAGVSLVEIDLVRQGSRSLSIRHAHLPARLGTVYAACVRRGWVRQEAEFYPIRLQGRLPLVNIPLRETDQDVTLDLQALLNQCLRQGRYVEDIDYSSELDPPLDPADSAWADLLLRAAGRRGEKAS